MIYVKTCTLCIHIHILYLLHTHYICCTMQSAAGQLHQVTSQRSTGRRKRNASENPPGQIRFLASKVCFGVDYVQKIPMISPENNPKLFPIISPRSRMIILEFLRSGWMCFFFNMIFEALGSTWQIDQRDPFYVSSWVALREAKWNREYPALPASVTVSLVLFSVGTSFSHC